MRAGIACILLLPLMTPCQGQGQTVITSRTPWPLVELAQALEREHGWLVDYEDPAYVYSGDLREVRPGSKLLGIRRNPVTFTIPLGTIIDSPFNILSSLLGADERAGNPGTFKVIADGGHLQIVPDRAKNSSGTLVTQASILDRPLHFPKESRNGSEIVYLIRNQLQDSGVNVVVGTIPTNYLGQTRITIGSDGESARSILLKTINGLQRPVGGLPIPTHQLVWRLLYAPEIEKPAFVINLELVNDHRVFK